MPPEGICVAVIVNFEAERDKQPDALDRLSQLVKDELERVNELILANMQSPVALIPQLAGHIIAAGGKRLRPVLSCRGQAPPASRRNTPTGRNWPN